MCVVEKSIIKIPKIIIVLSLILFIWFSMLGCRQVIKKEQQIITGTVVYKYSPAYSRCQFNDNNKYIIVSYNNKNYKFYGKEYYNKYQIGDKVKCTYEKTYFDDNSYEYDITNIIEKIK